ncbi:MAG: lytic transglycosylase domain-containing protein, partial [Chitinophagaceae bacterium]|nr:lytic transglycosylase domain-containing protein [Rubrivivax sp.]
AAAGSTSRPLPAALNRALMMAPEIDRVAADHRLDPLLLHAIARVESGHNASAVSHAGALGVMQVMPGTASRFGVSDAGALHLVPINLRVSARYLNVLQRRFPGDLRLVLAAYNAGEGAVERHGRRVPPYRETQAYVVKVLAEYARLDGAARRLSAEGAGAAP